MNTSIIGKQFKLTETIKSHVDSAISTLDKYSLDIISARTILTGDERSGKKGFYAEFIIELPNKNSVVIKQKDKDIYAAIDLAIERAQKVLRRHNDKIKDHKSIKASEALASKNTLADESNTAESSVDEIVPMSLELYKPREIEEVLEELKSSKRTFVVFYDLNDQLRVLSKLNNGSFGLY